MDVKWRRGLNMLNKLLLFGNVLLIYELTAHWLIFYMFAIKHLFWTALLL